MFDIYNERVGFKQIFYFCIAHTPSHEVYGKGDELNHTYTNWIFIKYDRKIYNCTIKKRLVYIPPWNLKTPDPWKKNYDQPRQHIKKQKHYFANKGPSSQTYGFSSHHVWMWELDHKLSTEEMMLLNIKKKKVLENTLESPLDCKEIKLVNPKGNKSWIFIGRTDAEAETPILWSPDAKSQLVGKDTDAGQDWRQEEKGRAEDEMVGWHHQLSGHEFEQTLWTGKPDMLQSMQSQRVRHDWEIELNWTIIPPQEMDCRQGQ